MNSQLSATALTPNLSFDVNLGRQAMFKLPDAAGLEVRCESGVVWITLDDDPRDVILEPEQTFTTTQHRQAILYAITPAKLAVSQPEAAVQPDRRQAQAARKAAFSWAPISGLSANGSVGLRA